jgi:hypothetical protein
MRKTPRRLERILTVLETRGAGLDRVIEVLHLGAKISLVSLPSGRNAASNWIVHSAIEVPLVLIESSALVLLQIPMRQPLNNTVGAWLQRTRNIWEGIVE